MPKIVDHAARRQELAEAVWRVIARVGIDNVTIREIARESGYSTGTLAHYFSNKDDILRSALELADAHVGERIRAMLHTGTPGTLLEKILSEALPLDDERAFELTLDVNYWARALNQPALRVLQHHDHDSWRSYIRDAVRDAQENGYLDATRRDDDITDVLVAFVDGIGIQALVYPELLTRRRVVRLLRLLLKLLAARQPTPNGREAPAAT